MDPSGSREYWPKEWPDWPEDPKVRKAVQSSFELGLWIIHASAVNRKSRLRQVDENTRNWLSQMTEEEQQQAKGLVALWERNALVQQSIRSEEVKSGVDAVDHLLPDWRSSGEEMRRAEDEALQLGLTVYEYFSSSKERFHILQEEKDEVGQSHDRPDYSELREQWYSRREIKASLPWAWDDMLSLCKRFEVREHETKERYGKRRLGNPFTIAIGVAGIIVTIVLHSL